LPLSLALSEPNYRTAFDVIGSDTTVMFALESIVDALWKFWSRGQRVERAGYMVGALLVAGGLVHLAILAIGGGSWEGPLSFRKPTTFGLSFGLTLITIVWVASFLALSDRSRSILLGVFTVACVLETALVTLQAWRGVPSHFNIETTFDGLVARTLAAGGFALVAIIVALTLMSFRNNPTVPISLRFAIQIGLIALVGAVVVGALMIAKGMMLVFAGHPQAAYATGGTLKPIHAVTMHGILVLPALAWLLSFAQWSERRRLAVVVVAAIGYIVLSVVAAFANAVGVDLWRMSTPTVALFVLGALSLVASSLGAVIAVARGSATDGIEPRSREIERFGQSEK
jgi:hypothetical protein